MAEPNTLEYTPLHDAHIELEARMMGFGGFDMPVQYSSIIEEHRAVREAAGLFDVSHMGEVEVSGPAAFDFVQQLVTNDAGKLYDGRAMYTVMCREDGGIVDDLLVYRRSEESYLLVINASNIQKDLAWMRANNPMDADLIDLSKDLALLALQGPKAFDIAQPFVEKPLDDLKFYHFLEAHDGAFMNLDTAIVSRTGYTGEKGLELYVPADDARTVWDTLLEAGDAHGLKPAGLGGWRRDTASTEMISQTKRTPTRRVSDGWSSWMRAISLDAMRFRRSTPGARHASWLGLSQPNAAFPATTTRSKRRAAKPSAW
jgi:aminomethyltransferase